MSPTIQALQEELAQRNLELKLINAIDHIRDSIHEPAAMLAAIVSLLAQELRADLCLLSLRDRDTGEMNLKAMQKNNHARAGLEEFINRDLAERAIALSHTAVWTGAEIDSELEDGVQVAAVPIILNHDVHLGALLLVRSDQPFTTAETNMLDLIEDHIDSAVMQGYHFHDLEQRNRELETIYQIDHIRDRVQTFDELLNEVLAEVQKILKSEVGFIMLYDNGGERFETRTSADSESNSDLFALSAQTNVLDDLAHRALEQGELICENYPEQAIHSVMGLPLIFNKRIIGVLGVANHYGERGFGQNDRQLLSAIGSQIDTAIFESMARRHLREVLGRSVDPRVMERLLEQSNGSDFLKGERRVVTVLYADIRGSTSLAEETEPELLVSFINDYLATMTAVVFENQGTLDKFVGDEVMALFGAPHQQEDHALRAVQTGLAMQKAHAALLARWQTRGIKLAPIGVGVATGELIVGEMGSAQRTDYTVLGRAANLGARICSVAQGGQVLISPQTYEIVADKVQATAVDGLQFKGVSGRMTVYNVSKVTDPITE